MNAPPSFAHVLSPRSLQVIPLAARQWSGVGMHLRGGKALGQIPAQRLEPKRLVDMVRWACVLAAARITSMRFPLTKMSQGQMHSSRSQ